MSHQYSKSPAAVEALSPERTTSRRRTARSFRSPASIATTTSPASTSTLFLANRFSPR